MMKIGDSTLMLADARRGGWEKGPDTNSTMSIWLYVEDCDTIYNNALKNGCQVIFPMADMFWGDRTGKLKDPYGHCWAIATFKWIYTPGEMKEKELEMMAKMPQN
jgi:PhnB protein